MRGLPQGCIYQDEGVLVIRWMAGLAITSVKELATDITSHPQFVRGGPVLFCVPPFDYESSLDEMKSAAREIGRHAEELGPVALVIEHEIHQMLGGVFSEFCLANGIRMQAFAREKAAVAWLREKVGEPVQEEEPNPSQTRSAPAH